MTRGGAPRTVLDAKTLKTTTPRWSDDRRTLAYAEKGEVFVQRIDDDEAALDHAEAEDGSRGAGSRAGEEERSRSRSRRSRATAPSCC